MGAVFQITPGQEAVLARHGLTSLEAMFGVREGERLDKAGLEGWRQRWRLELAPGTEGRRTFYLKRFEGPPLCRQAQRWREGHCLQSTAGVEWLNARLLAEAGIPAVRAAAYGQEMRGPWELRSFVLLEEVPGESLERWLPAQAPPANAGISGPRPPMLEPAGMRRLVDSAARLVGAFHAAGFVHRDLYLSHVFIAGESLHLIDLQRVFKPRWRRRRWVVKDLAALHFSTPRHLVGATGRLRFLCRYVRVCGRWGSARVLARAVAARACRMARRRPELAVGVHGGGRES